MFWCWAVIRTLDEKQEKVRKGTNKKKKDVLGIWGEYIGNSDMRIATIDTEVVLEQDSLIEELKERDGLGCLLCLLWYWLLWVFGFCWREWVLCCVV